MLDDDAELARSWGYTLICAVMVAVFLYLVLNG